MTLFENPIALSHSAARLNEDCRRYRAELRAGRFDPTGPFADRPVLSSREIFREIRDAGLPPELERAWQRWAFRFADARVNAPYHAAIAEQYRAVCHRITWDSERTYTLRELYFSVLTARGHRQEYLDTLEGKTTPLQPLTLERWSRRVEIAKRAGFGALDPLESPTESIATIAEDLLRRTDGVYFDLVPRDLEGFFDAAQGYNAISGWPAKLTVRTLESLLPCDGWLAGLALPRLGLPRAISPVSFCRGLIQLGLAMVEAGAPTNQPFVIAHDPLQLEGCTVGALLGTLPTLPSFGLHVLHLSRSAAREQARALAISYLIYARTQALKALLCARLCESPKELVRDYETLCHRAYGFTWPQAFAGLLPRLEPNSGQRLLGACLAVTRMNAWVSQFDEDWFRNPRGVEALRDKMSQVPPTSVSQEQAQKAVEDFATHLVVRLG